MRMLATPLLLVGLVSVLVRPLSGQVILSYAPKFDATVSGYWNCGTYGDPLHVIKGGKPEFWDMDDDGIPELFIGLFDYSGHIEAYRNIGTLETPCYVLEDPFFEGLTPPFNLEYAAP
ncbi:MAG: hypothetical protein KDC44_18750, partial [Phaeodactylibacter sp.]|nr:hypothetical protein [Phaeodactylibacter sp.]